MGQQTNSADGKTSKQNKQWPDVPSQKPWPTTSSCRQFTFARFAWNSLQSDWKLVRTQVGKYYYRIGLPLLSQSLWNRFWIPLEFMTCSEVFFLKNMIDPLHPRWNHFSWEWSRYVKCANTKGTLEPLTYIGYLLLERTRYRNNSWMRRAEDDSTRIPRRRLGRIWDAWYLWWWRWWRHDAVDGSPCSIF